MNLTMMAVLALVYVLSVAGASVTGYYKGRTSAENKARAQYATQLEQTIAEHNEDAAIDMLAAAEWGEANAKVRTKYIQIRSAANEATASNPAPANCALDPKRFGLLQLAIETANGDKADAASKLRSATDKANATGKPER